MPHGAALRRPSIVAWRFASLGFEETHEVLWIFKAETLTDLRDVERVGQ